MTTGQIVLIEPTNRDVPGGEPGQEPPRIRVYEDGDGRRQTQYGPASDLVRRVGFKVGWYSQLQREE